MIQRNDFEVVILTHLVYFPNSKTHVLQYLPNGTDVFTEHHELAKSVFNIINVPKPHTAIDTISQFSDIDRTTIIETVNKYGCFTTATICELAANITITHAQNQLAEKLKSAESAPSQSDKIIEIQNAQNAFNDIINQFPQHGDKTELEKIFDALFEPQKTHLKNPIEHIMPFINEIHPVGFHIVAGRPASGKTIALIEIAFHFAKHDCQIIFASYEMNKNEIVQRALVMTSQHTLTMDDVKSRNPTPEINAKKMKQFGIIEPALKNITFVHTHDIDHLCNLCSKIQKSTGKQTILVLDYIQLVPASKSMNKNATRENVVSDISRKLKLLAMSEIPVVAASQQSRAGVNKKTVDTLRESGALEQDADTVTIITRDGDQINCITDKNRHGNTGERSNRFMGQFMSITAQPYF